mgnify:CR=1 FL=1
MFINIRHHNKEFFTTSDVDSDVEDEEEEESEYEQELNNENSDPKSSTVVKVKSVLFIYYPSQLDW